MYYSIVPRVDDEFGVWREPWADRFYVGCFGTALTFPQLPIEAEFSDELYQRLTGLDVLPVHGPGPYLVSERFREATHELLGETVQWLPAKGVVGCQQQPTPYWACNLLTECSVIDLEKSDYTSTVAPDGQEVIGLFNRIVLRDVADPPLLFWGETQKTLGLCTEQFKLHCEKHRLQIDFFEWPWD